MSGGVESLSYFAMDGNYGDAAGITIIDTTGWTSIDFEMFDEVSDGDRPLLARTISEWKSAEDKTQYHAFFEKLGIPEDYYAT